jgi:hypothetical protein
MIFLCSKVTRVFFSIFKRLVYTTNSTGNGTSEVQTVQMASSTFQLGFSGVYTGFIDFFSLYLMQIFLFIRFSSTQWTIDCR